jgi:argininosuccinate lyase
LDFSLAWDITVAKKAWSGVFDADTDQRVEAFTQSVSYDQRLFRHDIQASLAHVQMLAQVGLLSHDEARQLRDALLQIQEEIERGKFQFRPELEDIHMHIEQALIDRLGDVGRKLHTARSRNDQVSTDLRLWVRDAIAELDRGLAALQRAFLNRTAKDEDVILPAYTHLRRAQPVLAAHYWLAYCEKFQRDRDRLADCRRRANVMPLGCAAVAGTTLPIDREITRKALGFDQASPNSLDASSDRDFVLELAFCCALIAEHLSAWAEEWIIWSTSEFDFLALPQAFCTGSSIMPQKINPDVLELTRGKTARVIGNLQALLVLVKGLPLAYNRDLQEDKQPLFDSVDTVLACLEIAAPLVEGAQLNRESINRRIESGYLDATTLMEHLIARGVPQRTAHEAVGNLVREAMRRQAPLAELPLDVFQSAHPELDGRVYEMLGAARAVAAFQSHGSTAPQEVRKQVARWRERLAQES